MYQQKSFDRCKFLNNESIHYSNLIIETYDQKPLNKYESIEGSKVKTRE